jgi:hypothetical protein
LNPAAKVSASAGLITSRTTGEQHSLNNGSSVRVGVGAVGTPPSCHTLTNIDATRLHSVTSISLNAKDKDHDKDKSS